MSAAAFPACIVILYLGGLFALSEVGWRRLPILERPFARSSIYVLGCCINWGVGTCLEISGVSGSGSETVLFWFVAPVLFAVAPSIIRRIVIMARQRGVTTVADFASAAYGKTPIIGAIMAVCLFVAIIPLNAVLLNAICLAFSSLLGELRPPSVPGLTRGFCIFVACAMAVFTIATGTRRFDNEGRQRGVALVVAGESLMQLVAVAVLSGYMLCWMFGGVSGLVTSVMESPSAYQRLTAWPHASVITLAVLSFAGLLFMPSQFHMTILENRDLRDIRRLAWIYPLLTILLVVITLPFLVKSILDGSGPDLHVIEDYAVPIHAQSALITAAALIAGFSAITSWMIVSTITIASVVSNDLVIPAFLHPWMRGLVSRDADFATRVLTIRRIAIAVSIFFACWCSVSLDASTLNGAMKMSLGLFAQAIVPCVFALVIKTPPERCAIQGMAAGLCAWAYMLVLPIAAPSSGPFASLLHEGPSGIAWLGPADFLGVHVETFTDGVFWSLAANILVFLATWALLRRAPGQGARAGASGLPVLPVPAHDAFFRLGHKVTLDALRDITGHYIGRCRAVSAFNDYLEARALAFDPLREADASDLFFGENLLATTIGQASAHLVVTLFLRRQTLSSPPPCGSRADECAALAPHNGAGVLSEAVLTPKHGMVLFDPDLRLVAWNVNNLETETVKGSFLALGLPLKEVVERAEAAGFYGTTGTGYSIDDRCEALLDTSRTKRNWSSDGRIFECRSLRLPDGFLSLHYIDITRDVHAEQTLEAEHETLERRVRERTEELQRLNHDLAKAKAAAEEANISKTRFLAAASHDLLQPLNAARLYATSLKERIRARIPADDSLALALNVEDSLEAVEDILTALLDISHLDAGATKPEMATFTINDIFKQLQIEFEPVSHERGLDVTFVASSLPVVSDMRLLRRLLRNFISNAIKYTPEGRVLIGVRRAGGQARIEVWDTGIGIPKSKQQTIFREFERLPDAMQTAPGAGLGLSIVERLSRLLDHEIELRSKPGRGSVFAVAVRRAATSHVKRMTIAAPAHHRHGPLDGLQVAVIDNETNILKGMSALLNGWGCQVTAATSQELILAALDEADVTPDVVIADYCLIDGDGISVISALRKRFGHLHAILITANRSPTLREMVQFMDIRFLNKPVKPAVLRSLLSRWRLIKQAAE